MNQKQKELASQYFEAYPKEECIHISSDDQVFLQSNHHDGVNHQRRIDEKASLTTIYRKQLVEKPETGDVTLTPDDTWTNAKIVEWLKEKGIEVKANTKKDELLAMVQDALGSEEEEEQEEEEEEQDAGEGTGSQD